MGTDALIDLLLGACGFAISWWVNVIWGMVRSQQEQITNLNVKLAENYAPRAEIDTKLSRILDTLEVIRNHQTSSFTGKQ